LALENRQGRQSIAPAGLRIDAHLHDAALDEGYRWVDRLPNCLRVRCRRIGCNARGAIQPCEDQCQRHGLRQKLSGPGTQGYGSQPYDDSDLDYWPPIIPNVGPRRSSKSADPSHRRHCSRDTTPAIHGSRIPSPAELGRTQPSAIEGEDERAFPLEAHDLVPIVPDALIWASSRERGSVAPPVLQRADVVRLLAQLLQEGRQLRLEGRHSRAAGRREHT